MLLTRRTNVLFDETDYATLLMYSQKDRKTIGELIRQAVKKTYKVKLGQSKFDRTLESAIKKSWKAVLNPEIPMDYKALIEDGRKY